MVMRNPDGIITTLYIIPLFTFLLFAVTQLEFPYSGSPDNLAPHRALILHAERQFYDKVSFRQAVS